MTDYNKVWIEVDVSKTEDKSELLRNISDAVLKVEGVYDISKFQHISSGEKVKSELELD